MGQPLLLRMILSPFLIVFELVMSCLLEGLFEDRVDLPKDPIHNVKVVQLDVLGEAYSEVDFDFLDEVDDALHDEVSPLIEFSEGFEGLSQLLLITLE